MLWGFRKSHGWRVTGNEWTPPRNYYLSTVPRYRRNHRVSRPVFRAIRILSSPDGIDAIRQRGRMRQPQDRLNKRSMQRLSAEMNAAIRWVLARDPTTPPPAQKVIDRAESGLFPLRAR
jgi:hypothetical protein